MAVDTAAIQRLDEQQIRDLDSLLLNKYLPEKRRQAAITTLDIIRGAAGGVAGHPYEDMRPQDMSQKEVIAASTELLRILADLETLQSAETVATADLEQAIFQGKMDLLDKLIGLQGTGVTAGSSAMSSQRVASIQAQTQERENAQDVLTTTGWGAQVLQNAVTHQPLISNVIEALKSGQTTQIDWQFGLTPADTSGKGDGPKWVDMDSLERQAVYDRIDTMARSNPAVTERMGNWVGSREYIQNALGRGVNIGQAAVWIEAGLPEKKGLELQDKTAEDLLQDPALYDLPPQFLTADQGELGRLIMGLAREVLVDPTNVYWRNTRATSPPPRDPQEAASWMFKASGGQMVHQDGQFYWTEEAGPLAGGVVPQNVVVGLYEGTPSAPEAAVEPAPESAPPTQEGVPGVAPSPAAPAPYNFADIISQMPTVERTREEEGGKYSGEVKQEIERLMEEMEQDPSMKEQVQSDSNFTKWATDTYGEGYNPDLALRQALREAKLRRTMGKQEMQATTRERIISGEAPATLGQYSRAKLGQMLNRDKDKPGRDNTSAHLTAEDSKGPDIQSRAPMQLGERFGQALATHLEHSPAEREAARDMRRTGRKRSQILRQGEDPDASPPEQTSREGNIRQDVAEGVAPTPPLDQKTEAVMKALNAPFKENTTRKKALDEIKERERLKEEKERQANGG